MYSFVCNVRSIYKFRSVSKLPYSPKFAWNENPLKILKISIFYSWLALYRSVYSKYSIHDAKQKHLGYKKVRGQSEAALQIGMCDQKL